MPPAPLRLALAQPISLRDSLRLMHEPVPCVDEMSQCLAAVAQRGDRVAFGLLFRHFAPRVAGFLMRGGMSAAEAEELAQETMAAVWHKAGQFDPARAGAATWIFTIARNRRIDRGRSTARAQAAGELLGAGEEEREPSAEDLALAGERAGRVREALARLSPEQAAVLRLTFYAEKPQSEIARELHIPLGTVKSRVRLAMARIRALLEEAP